MDCDSKKSVILRTATKHFANAGFDGARVDEIAAEAGVNKATLYYRVGNKEALYEEIFVEIIDSVLNQIAQNIIDDDPAEQQLINFATVFAESLNDNVYIAPLILREVASGGTHMNDQAILKLHQIRALLTAILKKGEDNNTFRKTNPFLIHMLLVGTLNFYSASASIRNKLSKTAKEDKDNFRLPITTVATEVVNLVLNSIRLTK